MTNDDSPEDGGREFAPGYILLDRYEVRTPLGEGGFATVYEAFDTTIERRIALKVLNLERFSHGAESVELVRKRFLREARLAAKIRHPAIIEIYDFGVLQESEQPYMMMEYLEGKDLDREIDDRGCIRAGRLLPLFVETLQGLGEAHEQGVVHKDLKPANLFLTNPGTNRERMKIVDFGIAHVHEEIDERLTQTGTFTGTPYYLSQEYLQEQEVRPEMDVYQMGLILVEALTGQCVITAETAYQAAIKHISRDFIIPPALLEGPLGEVIEQSIAFEPDDRFSTAAEFADALAEVDPATVEFEPAQMDTAPSGTVDAQQGAATGLASTEKQFGGAAQAPDGDDGPGEADDSEPKKRPSISESLSIEAINAAFGSTWPVKMLAVLGIGVVVTLVVMTVIIATDSGEQADPEGEMPEIAAASQQESDPPPRDEEPAEVAAADEVEEVQESDSPPPQREEEKVEEKVVALHSSPSGAEVSAEGGESLGTTPVDISLADGQRRNLVIEHSGYLTEELTVDAASDDVEVVRLREQPAEQRAERRPRRPSQPQQPATETDTQQQGEEPEEEVSEQEEAPEEQEAGQDWAMPGVGQADEDDDEQEEGDGGGFQLAP